MNIKTCACVFFFLAKKYTIRTKLKIATFSQYLHVKVKDFVKHLAGMLHRYKFAWAQSEDSNQSAHLHSLIRI